VIFIAGPECVAAFGDTALVTDRAMKAWYHPAMA
jgi:hypothetical protein